MSHICTCSYMSLSLARTYARMMFRMRINDRRVHRITLVTCLYNYMETRAGFYDTASIDHPTCFVFHPREDTLYHCILYHLLECSITVGICMTLAACSTMA